MDAASGAAIGADSAAAILARNGRSFHFASWFLDSRSAEACARLYAFCRTVDDIADEASDNGSAVDKLAALRRDLIAGTPTTEVTADFLELSDSYGLGRSSAITLVDAVAGDLDAVEVRDDRELLRYAYGVAGTVGSKMARLLGAHDPRAYFHAIDLGIAMQLTNIARDVGEDARNGRRYLPATHVGSVSSRDIADAPDRLRPILRNAVRRLLDLAERYYESAEDGIAYLPADARPAILVAARVYRAIGRRIAADGYATWNGRARVPDFAKVGIAARALWDLRTSERYRQSIRVHDRSLHRALVGLPGTNTEGGRGR